MTSALQCFTSSGVNCYRSLRNIQCALAFKTPLGKTGGRYSGNRGRLQRSALV
jgi:hypothetical protein